MYKFQYDIWDEQFFPGYAVSMNQLYDRSCSLQSGRSRDKEKSKEDIAKITQIFGYMEYYFTAILKLGYVGKLNFNNVLSQLKNIRCVKLLDPSYRKRYNGLSYNRVISMNPTPGKYPGMSENESLQLALFHELGHIITKANEEDIKLLKDLVYHETDFTKKIFPSGFDDFSRGFNLLDEVAVHNVGEAVYYDCKKKNRPPVQTYHKSYLNLNSSFDSNFVVYREFQELAYLFACCLDFISKEKNDTMCDVLDRLSKSMFSRYFCANLYLEFTRDPNKGEDLITMLMCMGKIKEAKYSSFGYGRASVPREDVSRYYELFHKIASQYVPDKHVQNKQKVQG